MAGLYDLVQEYFRASPERKREIDAERAQRFPFVKGWPQYPGMMYVEVVPNVWAWSPPMFGARYVDDDGNIVGGDSEKEISLFSGPYERLVASPRLRDLFGKCHRVKAQKKGLTTEAPDVTWIRKLATAGWAM